MPLLNAKHEHDGGAGLGKLGPSGSFKGIASGSYEFELSKFNTVTILILEDQIAALVDGKMVYEGMYGGIDTSGETVYKEHILGANETAVCEFDNFKLWDLKAINP